jgi:hypothetical protein
MVWDSGVSERPLVVGIRGEKQSGRHESSERAEFPEMAIEKALAEMAGKTGTRSRQTFLSRDDARWNHSDVSQSCSRNGAKAAPASPE